MNALNAHRHSFALCLVSQVFSAMRVEIPRNDIADFDVVAAEHFDNGVITGLDLNDEEPILRIYKYHGAIHRETSNV